MFLKKGILNQVSGGSQPPAEWSPAEIANVTAWWDASNSDNITQSSGFVSRVLNNIDNGNYDLIQSTSSDQPQTGYDINGISALFFDGQDDKLDCSGLPHSVGEFVYIGVYHIIAPNDRSSSIVSFNGGDSDIEIRSNDSSVFEGQVRALGNSNESFAPKLSNNTNCIFSFQVNTTDNKYRAYTFGNEVCIGDYNTHASTPIGLSIGEGIGATKHLNMLWSESIYASSLLTTDERQQIEGYFSHKYSIPLVNGHPYEINPPTL
jgi:hypothetical protein